MVMMLRLDFLNSTTLSLGSRLRLIIPADPPAAEPEPCLFFFFIDCMKSWMNFILIFLLFS